MPTIESEERPAGELELVRAWRLAQLVRAGYESQIAGVLELRTDVFFSSRRRHTRLQGDWSSDVCSSDLVTLDATRTFPDASTHAYIIEAFSPNRTKLTVTGAGLTDSVIVYVLPTELRGAISNTAPAAGSPITIQATPGLKFTNASTVTFGGGAVGFISQITPHQLQVITPYSDAGILTINHIDVAYDPGLTITLSTFAKVTPTGDVWTAADTGDGTAPALDR